MLRTLLATTALVTFAAAPALAQAQMETAPDAGAGLNGDPFGQAAEQVFVSPGDTVMVVAPTGHESVTLNFVYSDPATLTEGLAGQNQAGFAGTAQPQPGQAGQDGLTGQDGFEGPGQAGAAVGMDQHVVSDGGTIVIDGPAGAGAIDIDLRIVAQADGMAGNAGIQQDGQLGQQPAQGIQPQGETLQDGTMQAQDPIAQDPLAQDPLATQPAQPGTADGMAGQFSADQLIGATVFGADGDNIGNVDDVQLTAEGEVGAIIVDVGGFLGFGAHRVALPLQDVEVSQDQNQIQVFSPYTQQQLEDQPEFQDDGGFWDWN
ncbi:PRC-barrel domain-containing protein [Pelagibacterium limicola]|uniref:PRC-barrel domain-containing protein n=1 Tax=Pelagibacterium limicola TaxID=2791022 RepID=UPI0018AF83FC|nr:PRC-barrel domain-containing protein [Pelagibacterium limicola]